MSGILKSVISTVITRELITTHLYIGTSICISETGAFPSNEDTQLHPLLFIGRAGSANTSKEPLYKIASEEIREVITQIIQFEAMHDHDRMHDIKTVFTTARSVADTIQSLV